MAFRSDEAAPNAPITAMAGNVTFASDDRQQTVTSPVGLYVACFPFPEDPWHQRMAFEVRQIDPTQDAPPLLLLLDHEQIANLIEGLQSMQGMMALYDRTMN